MISALTVVLLAAAAFVPQEMATRPRHDVSHSSTFQQLSLAAAKAREENRDDAALQLYQQALKMKPEWDEGLWYLGTLLYEKERYFQACETLRRFVAQDPKAGYGWALLGMSEYETRDYDRALGHLQHSMAAGLGDEKKMASKVFYLTAVLLTRSERFDQSTELLFSMVAAGEATEPLVEPLGLATLRLPLLPSEIPAGRRDMVRMAGAAALALQAQHDGDAQELFRKLEAAYPEEPGVHFLVGAYLLGVRPEDGIKEMKRELEISPSHVPARIRLAEEYVKEGQTVAGTAMAQEAVKLAPKDALAHMALGEGLVGKGDLDGGTRELESARDLDPENVRVRWDLVRAYTAAGRAAEAGREKDAIANLGQQNEQH